MRRLRGVREGLQRRRAGRRRRRALRRRRPVNRVSAVLLALLVVLLVCVWMSLHHLAPAEGAELRLDELQALITDGEVSRAVLRDQDAQIEVQVDGRDGPLLVTYPSSDAATSRLLVDLTESGAEVAVDPQAGKAAVRVLLTVLLPLVILADLFALFLTWSRAGTSSLGEVQTFGEIGDRRSRTSSSGPSFDTVGGAEDAVLELREVVDYLRHPDRYREAGASAPKGVLLFGPPGCGKTLLAKAVAAEAGVPFFSVAGAEFVESLVGVGAARVRDLFRNVREVAPAIVFIDEIDAAGRRRGTGGAGGGSDEREQTLNQLLVEMDGFDASAGIVVIAATNRPDILDPALLRPGRFDRHVTVERPDLASRAEILSVHARGKRIATSVDFDDLARRTPGFTGADLANVVNEATLLALRAGEAEVDDHHFGEAILRVMGGPRRRGHLMTEAERRRLAIHEAGHAVVAARRTGAAGVLRVSLVARARSGGSTTVAGEHGVRDADQLFAELVVTVAGSAAEQVRFGTTSTAAEDDIERATALAMEIVGRFGFSEAIGPRRLFSALSDEHLGGDVELAALSPALHERFDAEVDRLLADAREAARADVQDEAQRLDGLVEALLGQETLEGAALAAHLTSVHPKRRARPAKTVAPA